jgi:hypothetical protein
LKLKYEEQLSNYAFGFNLHCYIEGSCRNTATSDDSCCDAVMNSAVELVGTDA